MLNLSQQKGHSQITSITQKNRWQTVILSPLWLCLLFALGIRIWLVYHTHGIIDGDEAVVGIQAEHILRGEHPYYFYGQVYMGSLEAYLMAILFAIAGPSVWMLRAEPILLSLLVVWLTWRLAGALADAAQLSPFARQLFQTIAALIAAVPPLYDTVVEMRALGGYVDTFVLQLEDLRTLNSLLNPYYHDRLSLFKDQLSFYLHYAAPRTIGGALPGENTSLTTIHALTLGLGLFCLCASCLLFLLSLFWHHPQLLRIRQLVALPLLYAVCVSIAFCTSIIATAGLISLQHDIAGRYAAPIMLVLPFFFAAVFTLAYTSLAKFMKRRPHNEEEQAGNAQRSVLATVSPLIALIAQVVLFA